MALVLVFVDIKGLSHFVGEMTRLIHGAVVLLSLLFPLFLLYIKTQSLGMSSFALRDELQRNL